MTIANPVLNAFAARPDRDEPVSDWLYAVEEHLRDRTLFTEFDEDSELRLSVWVKINALRPTDADLMEARAFLAACARVLDDQRQNDDDEEMTDSDLLRHVRNTLLLPDEPSVAGGWHIEDDGSAIAQAYITVVAAPNEAFGDNRH